MKMLSVLYLEINGASADAVERVEVEDRMWTRPEVMRSGSAVLALARSRAVR